MKHRLVKGLLVLVVVMATVVACKKEEKGLEERLKGHVAYLTSDECDGREPFTVYADNAARYIAEQMKEIGLLPYREDGEEDYLQQVKLVKISIDAPEELVIEGNDWNLTMAKDTDFTLVTQDTGTVDFSDCELIFAGYGIVAPEYGKNDYEGLENPQNKIALVIINDPGLDNPDSSYFCGNEMTYYGRWTYKMEEGARQGLAGVIILHNDRGAGYGWNVASASSNVKFIIDDPSAEKTIPLQGWMSNKTSRTLLALCGWDYDELFEAAKKPDFKPFALNCKTSVRMTTTYEKKETPNIVGYIAGGGDAQMHKGDARQNQGDARQCVSTGDCKHITEESVIVCAHWDHIGMSPGATDNATGVAWLLETARALIAKGKTPKRNIVFLSPTCEEKGMYGSKYHASHPMFPLEKARAIVNMDVVPLWGKSKTLTITGYGHYPEMDAFVAKIAERHGRTVVPDPESHNGMFYRSDQLPFMQRGVTPLFAKGWEEKDGRIENYWKNVYHTANDKMNDWDDYSGLAEEVELFVDIIWELANE